MANYEMIPLDEEFTKDVSGILLVHIKPTPDYRKSLATVLLDGEIVASGYAEDRESGVSHNPAETLTVPIPASTAVIVETGEKSQAVTARWFSSH